MSCSANSCIFPGVSSGAVTRGSGSIVEEFMEQCKEEDFQILADNVMDMMDEIIKEYKRENPLIKYQASARTKKRQNLQDKLLRENANNPYQEVDAIRRDNTFWNLACVRLLIYFPDDAASLVWHMIHKQDKLRLMTYPVARHSVRELKNVEKERRGETRGQAEVIPYIDGSLAEKEKDGFVRRWKHAGYRAVHFHVVPRKKDEEEEERPAPVGGLTELDEQEKNQSDVKPWQDRVEIQIMSVVMHAWSEVEHDLIYKNPRGLPQSPSLDRMLDAINGLAITSEILLQKLQLTCNTLEQEGIKPLTGADGILPIVRSWAQAQLAHVRASYSLSTPTCSS